MSLLATQMSCLEQLTFAQAKHLTFAYCRFGNPVIRESAGLSFDIQTDGPGPVDLDCLSSHGELSQVQLLARQAGAYSFALMCTPTQQIIGARPVEVSTSHVLDFDSNQEESPQVQVPA